MLLILQAPSGPLHWKKFQKTLISAFEANSAALPKLHFFQILAHYLITAEAISQPDEDNRDIPQMTVVSIKAHCLKIRRKNHVKY